MKILALKSTSEPCVCGVKPKDKCNCLPIWQTPVKAEPEAEDKPFVRRENAGKPDFSLLPLEALEGVVRVLEYGSKKYRRNSWQQKGYADNCLGSAMRHLKEEIGGRQKDPESGQDHLDHIICNLLFIQWHRMNDARKQRPVG